MTPARARTRRRLAGVAASLAVHATLLLAFMSVAPRLVTLPRLTTPPEEAFEVELERPQPTGVSSASAAAAPRRAKAAAVSAEPLALPPPRPAIRPSDLPAPAPAASAHAAAPSGASAVAGQAADDGRWRVKGAGGDSAGDAARALVRGTVGCGAAGYLHLASAELDHCYAEYLRGMRTLRPDAIPAAKRAYYDQVVASYAKMHAPMPLSGANLADNLGVEERWHPPQGAKMPALGCEIRVGGVARGWKTYANRKTPPHSLKLGVLPCFITPPSGYGTEEADVPPPASLREQQDDAAHAARYAPPGG